MKILIIQQKMIGDVLTTSLLFEVLRNHYPDTELHYLINSYTKPVVKHNPFIDEFKLVTPEIEKSKRAFFSFLQSIRAEKYDIVIDIYSKISSSIITSFSRANKKIGENKSYLRWAYTHYAQQSSKSVNNVPIAYTNRLEFLTPLIEKIDFSIEPKIFIREEETLTITENLKKQGIALTKPITMINCLGSSKSKTYPLVYMSKILDHIVQTLPDNTILLNYIPSQVKDVEKLISLCNKNTQQSISRYYGPSLRGFIVLCSLCDSVIGNEGGAINIGKALGLKTFAIFSPWINEASWKHTNTSKHSTVHLKHFNPELFNHKNNTTIKKDFSRYYKEFKPSLIIKQLSLFLDNGIK